MITFEKIRWKNFLSTGNTFTEVDLTANKTNIIVGTNGAGKSTILDALTFSLFGKPYRKINKPMLVNSINDKDCVVEIEFSIYKNRYKVVRGIKPAVFEIYCNDMLWNKESTVVDQQKNFEQTVLKMNYKSFTQIVVLGSSNFVPFMRLPVAQRREIIEDILDIQVFSAMNVKLKEHLKILKTERLDLDNEIKLVDNNISLTKSFIKEQQEKDKEIIVALDKQIVALEKETSNNWMAIKEYEMILSKLEEESKSYTTTHDLSELNKVKGRLESKSTTANQQWEFFDKNHTCPSCSQSITDDIRIKRKDELRSKLDELDKAETTLVEMIASVEKCNNLMKGVVKKMTDANHGISLCNSVIRRNNNEVKKIAADIDALENKDYQIESKGEELKNNEIKLGTLKKESTAINTNLNTAGAATILLKDNGVKSSIIKKYLPTMNTLINQYLQNMDFYVNFTLDESFEETIKSRYRDVFSYESFSEGEKARIDIALLLTWRSVAKLKNSVDTNLLILDEIFDGSLDQNGSSELGWILRNFDDKTNVFVISHKEGLEDKFDATLSVKKVQNYSVIERTLNEVVQGD